MLKITYTTRFKKDVKRMNKRGKNMKKLKELVDKLVNEKPLEKHYIKANQRQFSIFNGL